MTRRLIALSLAIILLNSATALACGPFTLEAVFVHTVHPAYPLAKYAAGRIGVVQPTYARSYLYTAYRYLSGSSFSSTEQKALVDLWKQRLDFSPDDNPGEWSKVWLEARKKVPGVQDRGDIDVYRAREKPNEYESYVNCNKKSFAMAAMVLKAHIDDYGAESAVLRSWVDAQDQVFSNCSEGTSIPEPLPPGSPPLARADRAYQIAAAHFYSANFDEAKTRFEQIAADTESEWQLVSRYMVARTLIRKASLGAPEQKQESLRAAESQLAKILADKQFVDLHASATGLANLVRLRLHPKERLHELGRVLTTQKQNDNLKQDLWDYTTLLDQYLEVDDAKQRVSVKGDDLSDWIATIESFDPPSLDYSLSRWQETKSDAWFVAALSKIESSHTRAGELIAQALNVKPTAAAFASARFHAVRLMIESGKTSEARALLDQFLKNNQAQFDESSFNLLMTKRMLVATSMEDFISATPRVPAALSWNDDGREIPADDESVSAEMKELKLSARFDYAAGTALNQQIPLTLLKQVSVNKYIIAPLRRDIAQAAWLRAVILGDTKTADEIVPALSALVPELSTLLHEYLSATTPQAKKAIAIYAWLKFPGLEPVVDIGIGRRTPLNQQDSYRDNWWCGAAFYPLKGEDESRIDSVMPFTDRDGQPLLFLSPVEKAAAYREWNALVEIDAGPNYLAQQVIQWTNRTPNDPRVPEALHLAVKTTRYGCTDKDSGRWSKAAFDLLHRKYPNTTWAKKTPHWFKD